MTAMALMGLFTLGTGCDQEPRGSCITSSFSTNFDTYGTQESCQEDVTASACSDVQGEFDEGGGCAAFDLLHLFTAN
jgi:hypothetical protein